jgi:type II secretory pathway pseudopilin PulG
MHEEKISAVTNGEAFKRSCVRHMRSAFTLVELLVVVGMVAVLMGAMTTAVNGARERARIQKATSDVKVISQAILAYEVWNGDQLPTMGSRGSGNNGVVADMSSLGFLIGKDSAQGATGSSGSGELPVLLMAQLRNNGEMVDPWGTPYRVTIAEASASIRLKTVTGTLQTGYWLPNFYRNWGN